MSGAVSIQGSPISAKMKLRTQPPGQQTLKRQKSEEEKRDETLSHMEQEKERYNELKKRREALEEKKRKIEDERLALLASLEADTAMINGEIKAAVTKSNYNPAFLPKLARNPRKPVPIVKGTKATEAMLCRELDAMKDESTDNSAHYQKVVRPPMVPLVKTSPARGKRSRQQPVDTTTVTKPRENPQPAQQTKPTEAQVQEDQRTEDNAEEEEEEDGVFGKVVAFVSNWWSS